MEKKNETEKPTLDLMFDIETFSTNLDKGMVVSIGIQSFALYGPVPYPYRKYVVIIPDSSQQYGRITDEATMKWWKLKNPNAYYFLERELHSRAKTFDFAWSMIMADLSILEGHFRLKVWSKGIDFDFPMIESSLRDAGMIETQDDLPYHYWDKCDVRSILQMAKRQGWKDPTGPASHNALDDCQEQILQLRNAVEYLGWDHHLTVVEEREKKRHKPHVCTKSVIKD